MGTLVPSGRLESMDMIATLALDPALLLASPEELHFPAFCRACLAQPLLVEAMLAETKSHALASVLRSGNETPLLASAIIEEERAEAQGDSLVARPGR